MRLAVISHKESWRTSDGYATTGGFPVQIDALSQLFDCTEVVVPVLTEQAPAHLKPLSGRQLHVSALRAHYLPGGLRRKATVLLNLPQNWPRIWRAVAAADVVHTPVPGDIGTLGIIAALLQQKRLFVRYCTEWQQPQTTAALLLRRLLTRVAGGRNVVLVTGGGQQPPVPRNAAIDSIFATTLTQATWQQLPQATTWQPGQTLRLISVGRLEPIKNLEAVIAAVAQLADIDVHYDIVGHGSRRDAWQQLADQLGVADRVRFHGNLPPEQVMQRLAGAHLFVMPSLAEGFPKAALEAMACGLPIVATGVSVLPQIVDGCGELLAAANADAVAHAVRQFVAAPHLFTVYGQRARIRSRDYTLERWQQTIAYKLESAWGITLRQPLLAR